jgi:hypothetical protein
MPGDEGCGITGAEVQTITAGASFFVHCVREPVQVNNEKELHMPVYEVRVVLSGVRSRQDFEDGGR